MIDCGVVVGVVVVEWRGGLIDCGVGVVVVVEWRGGLIDCGVVVVVVE